MWRNPWVRRALGTPQGRYRQLADMTTGSLASFLALQRASASGITVQTGTSAIAAVASPDTPRFGRLLDAHNLALSFEEARGNYALDSQDVSVSAAWNLAGISGNSAPVRTAHQVTGPDGTPTIAARLDYPACSNGNGSTLYQFYSSPVPIGTSLHWSAWLKGVVGGEQIYIYTNPAIVGSYYAKRVTLTTSWQRFSLPLSMIGSNLTTQIGCDLRSGIMSPTSALSLYVGDCQLEAGGYTLGWQTDNVITGATPNTRPGERLYAPSAADMVSAGRLPLSLTFRPKAPQANFNVDAYFAISASDPTSFIKYSSSTNKITVSVAGASWTTTNPIAWTNAGDTIDIELLAGSASLQSAIKYRVNGGAKVDLGTSGAPQGAWPSSGALDLMCSGTASQFTSYIEKVAALNGTNEEAWV